MRTVDAAVSAEVARDEHGSPGVIVVHSPDASERQRFYPLDPAVELGRRDAEQARDRVALEDARMSRRHATLRMRGDGAGCEVRDLDSRNGTFVDGRRVGSAHAPVGSIVRAGDSFFEVALAPIDIAPHPLICGRARAMSRVFAQIRRAGPAGEHVLIEGETGTGKELIAEALHAESRRPGRLVAVNCAAIPSEIAESFLFGHKKGAFTGAHADAEGVFEQAHDGTLLLDEIGELRLDLQAKLLRVLETRQVTPVGAATARPITARVVSATNAALRVAAAAGTFRTDLYARLSAIEIAVPPLRARRSDIPLLAEALLARAAPSVKLELSANAIDALLRHRWPMNVRELRSLCQRLALLFPRGGSVRLADVAPHLGASECADSGEQRESSVPLRAELVDLLEAHRGNVLKLAAHYGKDRKQIYRWLEHHALAAGDFR